MYLHIMCTSIATQMHYDRLSPGNISQFNTNFYKLDSTCNDNKNHNNSNNISNI